MWNSYELETRKLMFNSKCDKTGKVCVNITVRSVGGRLRLKCDGSHRVPSYFNWTLPQIWIPPLVASWNVMAHAQKPDFVFRRNGRVHLNRCGGRQFSRLLAAEVCASAVVMLDTPRSEVVWRVLATHCIRQFPLHFPSRALPCAITFQLDSTTNLNLPLSGQLKCDGTRAETRFRL